MTPFAKDLLELPCMKPGTMDSADADPTCHYGAMWRSSYAALARAGEAAHTQIGDMQRESASM